jgi:hypothetical protein
MISMAPDARLSQAGFGVRARVPHPSQLLLDD